MWLISLAEETFHTASSLKTQHLTVICNFSLRKIWRGKSQAGFSRLHRFRKAPFAKCFLSTQKQKTGVFEIPPAKERFWKAAFSCRVLMNLFFKIRELQISIYLVYIKQCRGKRSFFSLYKSNTYKVCFLFYSKYSSSHLHIFKVSGVRVCSSH